MPFAQPFVEGVLLFEELPPLLFDELELLPLFDAGLDELLFDGLLLLFDEAVGLAVTTTFSLTMILTSFSAILLLISLAITFKTCSPTLLLSNSPSRVISTSPLKSCALNLLNISSSSPSVILISSTLSVNSGGAVSTIIIFAFSSITLSKNKVLFAVTIIFTVCSPTVFALIFNLSLPFSNSAVQFKLFRLIISFTDISTSPFCSSTVLSETVICSCIAL